MKKHLWKVMGLVALLALLVGAAPLAAEELEPAGPINSLRVYGKEYENAKFPYDWYYEPYDLTADAAPPKDFVQFNPALIHVFYDDMGKFLKCGYDAAEKVHARMWYVPKLVEPVGWTYPEVRDPVVTADIVFEYIYTMLAEDSLDPIQCDAGSQMVFPMVGGVAPGFPNEQLGLEGYDVNNDGQNEILKLEEIWDHNGTRSTIVVSPQSTTGAMRLHKGDVIEFLDYAVKVIDEPTTMDLKVEVAIYYTGWKHNQWKFVGQASLWLHDKAAVDARHGPVRMSSSPEFWRAPMPVMRPFWIEATYVGTDFVTIKPYRILTAGETFFVDGAEYDVSAIFTEEGGLKYIALRNPLPKGEGDIFINDISVYKRRVPANTSLPMLPPFNMEHDELDDTNIDGGSGGEPDKQAADKDLLDRLMEDMPPYDGAAGDPYSYIAWIEETKEWRFDTNLLEEKFTEVCNDVKPAGDLRYYCEEYWEWINIETMPWDYTEFILPMRRDLEDPGDYILVSSWRTQEDEPCGLDGQEQGDCNPNWPVDGSPVPERVRVKFVYDAEVSKRDSADIYVNDAEYNVLFRDGVDANSLRVYGRCIDGESLGAKFPYKEFDAPFNIGNENWEKPEKDFIVHNPALLNHLDPDNELYSNIIADEDAHEKVHLRTWYDPCYVEPAGMTDPEVPGVKNEDGDIVNEYTYLLLDDASLNPTHGSYDRTQMVFPMAGLGGQVGLDRYDVNGDGTDEIMSVERITDSEGWPYCNEPTTDGEIIVSPEPVDAGNMQLNLGDTLEFFDYAVTLVDTASAETRALFDVWYTGYRYDEPLYVGQVELFGGPFGIAFNTAIVDAGDPASIERYSYWDHPLDDISEQMEPVDKPFAFLVDHVSTDYVSIKPFRVLTAGETFFVDGAEYDVAAIGVVPGDTWSEAHGCYLCELKYITLRNPIPKGDGEFFIPKLTRWKVRFGDQEILPVLPPFNHEHDIVDDVNIPELGVDPDVQYPDNVVWEDEDCWFEFPPDSGLFWGCESGIHELFNTIAERIVEDVGPFEFWWLAEEKEERFDTDLKEEKWKFTDTGEKWQWINIATMPWHFTEFVLPEIPDVAPLEDLGIVGDYILVSSFMTEDGVRVKFSYDATDGTGLYVNSYLCEPARVLSVSSNSPVDQYADVELTGVVENADSFEWDFGALTGCTGEDTLTPTCSGDVPGEFEVTLTVMNECAEHTEMATVVVEKCPGDFDIDWGFRDLADIMAMLPAWNTDCGDAAYDEMFDFDGDCHIGLYDIMQVVAVWNTPCPGGTP